MSKKSQTKHKNNLHIDDTDSSSNKINLNQSDSISSLSSTYSSTSASSNSSINSPLSLKPKPTRLDNCLNTFLQSRKGLISSGSLFNSKSTDSYTNRDLLNKSIKPKNIFRNSMFINNNNNKTYLEPVCERFSVEVGKQNKFYDNSIQSEIINTPTGIFNSTLECDLTPFRNNASNQIDTEHNKKVNILIFGP